LGDDLQKKSIAPTVAVGFSEGNWAISGKRLGPYFGHTDPGNHKTNRGSFSYQHVMESPEDADKKQIEKFKTVLLPLFLKVLPRINGSPKILWAIACDVFVQSEDACIPEGGFLDQLFANGNYVPTISKIVDWRVQSYFEPATGELNAPGFGNSLERLREDQRRKTDAIFAVLKEAIT
jgi:hypothetical protein